VGSGSLYKRKRFHGLPDQNQDIPWEDTQLKNTVQAEKKREKQGWVVDVDVNFDGGFLHIHVDDDAEIIKNRDQTGQNSDDHERNQSLPYGGRKHVKLGQESTGGRKPSQ
jgi:hypothetical protein